MSAAREKKQRVWYGPAAVAVYVNKDDPRVWVPRRIPWMGWTVNLARPAGIAWLAGLVLVAIAINLLTRRVGQR